MPALTLIQQPESAQMATFEGYVRQVFPRASEEVDTIIDINRKLIDGGYAVFGCTIIGFVLVLF